MFRMYLMQNWFNLFDEGMEEAICDSYSMRSFLGVNVIDEQVSDATAMLKFRHLIEKHHIGEKIFQDVTDHPEYKGKILESHPEVDFARLNDFAVSSKKKEEHILCGF